MSSRPEHLGPPELFYNDAEAQKYTYNSRVMEIQAQMCERALELLMLPDDQKSFLLDIGCGSGLSGTVLEDNGHCWVGIDISTAMLKVANDRDVEGDLVVTDMGQGIPFKAASFDGAISISALQWICNIDKTSYTIHKRLNAFFQSLFACLSSGARAVFQFYPENDHQIGIITSAATRAGFFGGTIVDFPNSKKAKKFFLVLMTTGCIELPRALDGSRNNLSKRKSRESNSKEIAKCRKNWIMKKKERHRKLGKLVKADSKYSGRKRSKRN